MMLENASDWVASHLFHDDPHVVGDQRGVDHVDILGRRSVAAAPPDRRRSAGAVVVGDGLPV